MIWNGQSVAEWSSPFFEETDIPCLLLDYVEFQELTFFRPTEERFVGTLREIFSAAREYGLFPRSRFGLVCRWADGVLATERPRQRADFASVIVGACHNCGVSHPRLSTSRRWFCLSSSLVGRSSRSGPWVSGLGELEPRRYTSNPGHRGRTAIQGVSTVS